MKTTNLPIYNVAVSAETEPRKFIEYAGTVALAYDDAKYIAHAANSYQELVAALRNCVKAQDATGGPKGSTELAVTEGARFLLRKLGEWE